MKIIVEPDYESMSRTAGLLIGKEVRKNPNIVLGLATGSTPIGTYKQLIRMYKEENLDFSNAISFNLDEYIGLEDTDKNSYRYFMDNELFNEINIKSTNTNVPSGTADDMEKYCELYDTMIDEVGGIDLQVLGIGANGHIAFNEPADALCMGSFIVNLTKETINANSRFFDSIDEVPKTAISMGIGSILKAKKIILLANGKGKADIIKKMLEDKKITTQIPASFLLLHQDVTLIVDEDAYSLVK